MEGEDLLKIKQHKKMAMPKGKKKMPRIPKVSLAKKTRKRKG